MSDSEETPLVKDSESSNQTPVFLASNNEFKSLVEDIGASTIKTLSHNKPGIIPHSHSSSTNSTTRSVSNSFSPSKLTPNSNNKQSTGSTNNFNASQMSYKSSLPGNRTSIMSDYSGVVQHVDIDTIKYVGNKESLHLSQLNGLSSSSNDSLNMDVIFPIKSADNNSKDKEFSSTLTTTTGTPNRTIDNSDLSRSTNPSLKIPVRSARRLQLTAVDNENMAKVIKNKNESSPNKQPVSSAPPKSPLPKLTETDSKTEYVSSSPIQKKKYRNSSSSSEVSLHLHGRLDDIMKEVEDLKLEFIDDKPEPKPKSTYLTKINNEQTLSMSSKTNSLYTSSSFHTAQSDSINLYSDNGNEFDNFDEEPTPNLHIIPKQKSDTSSGTMKSLKTSASTSKTKKEKSISDDVTIQKSETLKSQTKTSSSHSHHGHHSHQSRHSSSNKAKRRSTSSKNKIKPFSYETLAKLLNATDGIIIGQEFATLNIPTEEKFLIERIVDSISRLTANMMLNPARYDQSCARLEHVLNVLEGFE